MAPIREVRDVAFFAEVFIKCQNDQFAIECQGKRSLASRLITNKRKTYYFYFRRNIFSQCKC